MLALEAEPRWETQSRPVPAPAFLEAHLHRAKTAALGLTRQGSWTDFIPALQASRLERFRLHWAELSSGESALAVTDEDVTSLVGVLLLVPPTSPPRPTPSWVHDPDKERK